MAEFDGPNIDFDDFPHLENLDVAKTLTTFDYSKWGAKTKIWLKNVPALWGSDYDHTVAFATKTARDAYLRTSAPVQLNTEAMLRPEGVIRLPIGYDTLALHNYLSVQHAVTPVPEDTTPALRDYFYFIRDIRRISPSVTEVALELDVWQTLIYDVQIDMMDLERGHFAFDKISAETYLTNPAANAKYLTAPDVTLGLLDRVTAEDYRAMNTGDQYVLIATSGVPGGDWEDQTRASLAFNINLTPTNYRIFAIEAENYSAFMLALHNQVPQFIQTIAAVITVDEKFVTLGNSFSFAGHTCYLAAAKNATLGNLNFTKTDFGYPSQYADLAKLYTFPYAVCEVSDGSTVHEVRIEACSSSPTFRVLTSLAFPFLKWDISLVGVGGSGAANNYSIRRMGSAATATLYQSDWENYRWIQDIPHFGVFQSAAVNYDFATKFDRLQRLAEIAQAETNAKRTNTATRTSTLAAAANTKTNADLGATTSREIDVRNISDAWQFGVWDRDLTTTNSERQVFTNREIADAQLYVGDRTYELNMATMQDSYDTKTASNIIGAATSIAGGLTSPAGFASGSVTAVNAAYSALSSGDDLVVKQGFALSAHLISEYMPKIVNGGGGSLMPGLTNEGIIEDALNSNIDNLRRADRSQVTSEANSVAAELLSNTTAANDLATVTANANRTSAANVSNIEADAALARTGVARGIEQAALGNNLTYGSWGGDAALDAMNRRGIDIRIKTQPAEAISRTGDIFLRYGYAYDSLVRWTTWRIMENFTYWKTREVWIKTAPAVAPKHIQLLQDILRKGVTVWSDPAKVGAVTIYQNGVAE